MTITTDNEQKKRTIRLITDPKVEKVWAATKFLSLKKAGIAGLGCAPCWVSIEEIGDFLKKRQIDAGSVQYHPDDPNTRYALEPNSMSRKGWDDHTIVCNLATAEEQGFLARIRKDGVNFFVYLPTEDHDLWKIPNTEVPYLPSW